MRSIRDDNSVMAGGSVMSALVFRLLVTTAAVAVAAAADVDNRSDPVVAGAGENATETAGVGFGSEDAGFSVVVGDGDGGNLTRIGGPFGGAQPQSRLHYDGYKVVRAVAFTPLQLAALVDMTYDVSFDFWSQPRMIFTPVDIVVDPESYPRLRERLRESWIVNWLTSNDVERSFFSAVGGLTKTTFGTPPVGTRFSFDQFGRLADIYARLDEYAASYPAEVTVTVIGKSHEGREIKMVRLTDGQPAPATPKKVIFLDGGTHAREWITTSTVMYILDQLMSLKPDNVLRTTFDWHIVPMVNPDGYEYTQTTDRFWRKNRAPIDILSIFGRRSIDGRDELPETRSNRAASHSPDGGKPSKRPSMQDMGSNFTSSVRENLISPDAKSTDSRDPRTFFFRRRTAQETSAAPIAAQTSTQTRGLCLGVDLNRNWGHYWGKIGVDFNPCSFTFPGTKAFSELETQAMRDAFETVHDRTLLYISYHSYGEMILLPWGYTYLVPSNFNDMKDKARTYAGKMTSWYKVGSGTWLLYPAAGVTMDWVTFKGVPYVFTIELSPGRLGAVPGFAIPASEIVRVGKENWAGLQALTVELARGING